MAINKQDRQVQVAGEVEEAARTLAHSTREVPNPADSYSLLGELAATISHLRQVAEQLASWHERVVDGREYVGEDERGDGATGTITAAAHLHAASAALNAADEEVRAAHSANGVIRWRG